MSAGYAASSAPPASRSKRWSAWATGSSKQKRPRTKPQLVRSLARDFGPSLPLQLIQLDRNRTAGAFDAMPVLQVDPAHDFAIVLFEHFPTRFGWMDGIPTRLLMTAQTLIK